MTALRVAMAAKAKIRELEQRNGQLQSALNDLRGRFDDWVARQPTAAERAQAPSAQAPPAPAAATASSPVERAVAAMPPAAAVPPVQAPPVRPPQPALPPRPVETPEPPPRAVAQPAAQPAVAAAAAAAAPAAVMPAPRPAPAWFDAARRWLFTGNLVAKLGLVILLIGVSFLLKYVASQVVIPIELRIAAVAVADIFLLRWGWRIRTSRRAIGLPVQGAAIGILELLTFASFRLYELIPGSAAFVLLFVLTVFTCLLAVMQNALWLALFGIVTGFAAPILTSTGGGSHVGLFSYYVLLNAGILAIALKRSWRELNLAGFVMTFGIGMAWGLRSYTPADYLSVQLFLVLFMLFYTGIPLAFAASRKVGQRPYVDAVLVFGTPVAGAGLQFSLVRDMPFGVALAALGLGLYYTALALVLWRRQGERLRELVGSFLTVGVLFGTLAIPMALDGRATSAAWAAEGAAIVWAGLYLRRRGIWLFGLALQLGAWLAFLGSAIRLTPGQAADAALWLGFLILAASAGAMAWRFQSQQDEAAGRGREGIRMALWWLTGGTLLIGAWTEINLRADGTVRAALLAGSVLLLCAVVATAGPRLRVAGARVVALLAQLLAALAVLWQVVESWRGGTGDWAERPVVAILMVTGAALFSGWRLRAAAPRWSRAMLAWGGIWWFGSVLSIGTDVLAGFIGTTAGIVSLDWWCAYALCVAASALLFSWSARRLAWPALRWLAAPSWLALAVALATALLVLYSGRTLGWLEWSVLAVLLVVSETLLLGWARHGWALGRKRTLAVHALRTVGPWLVIWPAGYELITRWLAGPEAYRDLLAAAGWDAAGLWGQCLPAWLQFGVLAWLLRAVHRERWPVAPFGQWYARRLLPLATAWCVLRVLWWNLTQDGGMAPLPYVPLLNPVDLSTAFVAALVAAHYRVAAPGRAAASVRLRWAAGLAAFGWLNLMLLRTASHVLDLPYEADLLFASRAVQAMLSLVWALSALVLMRFAVRRALRPAWLAGAAILALVVVKLFLVDLDGSGSMERIVSFLGVGLLMLAIGYLAPFPTERRPSHDKADGEAA
ncbi:DUF2339 domain-containing protein [Pseudoduganella chitinolytica]|uniref:DUF2339 domain-containing protein n=1 Tax=Pseudoduganella chitinolytica TaxID=34070 RepID=A0ABY8BJN1_9BURK|nr:DUF2339 domain-containing protein [Pseudoduganella chitinolytica]WEF35613.1 DUF2339 domain-containing protein [Pseudoduganella chitinolytica]